MDVSDGVADRDAIPDLRRRQLQAHLVVVDAVGLDANLLQQVHQRARAAAQVDHPLRLEDVLDQLRVLRLDAAARLERVVVVAGAPFAQPVVLVVVLLHRGLLCEDGGFELGDGHRGSCCAQ